MKLTAEDIKEFQGLYLKRFGKEINYDKAYEQGSKLVHLISLVCRQNKENENEDGTDRDSTRNG